MVERNSHVQNRRLLLQGLKERNHCASATNTTTTTVLAEIIGATGLQHPKKQNRGVTSFGNSESLNPFVIVSFYKDEVGAGVGAGAGAGAGGAGTRSQILQTTETLKGTNDPIWCIEHKCLFLLPVPHGILQESSLYRVQFDVRHEDFGVGGGIGVGRNPMKCTQIGVVSMSLKEILGICSSSDLAEKRMELKLVGNKCWKERGKEQRRGSSGGGGTNGKGQTCHDESNDGSLNVLAVRFRYASTHDKQFVQDLEREEKKTMRDASIWTSARNLLNDGGNPLKLSSEKKHDNGPKFITEMAAQEVGVGQLMRMFTKKSKRGKDGVLRILVQPGPDPKRESVTTYLSEEELVDEMYKPSSNWIECGTDTKDSLGEVYLEILRCEGLPNMDSGETFGNKTDAFVCAIYEESMVQTDVIDDRLSPMWMPWSQRAFCFHIRHPLSQMFISVNDFDLGPTGHDGIGKIAINLNHFEADVVYTLKYNIHPASNIYDREVSNNNSFYSLRCISIV
jgi:C2 domain.